MAELTAEQQSAIDAGTLLPLMEDFYTIQGEGFNTGKAAYFIRLGGCDVGCHWCDVKESWDAYLHPLTETKNIVERASSFTAKSIVITGGEPLMYNLDVLCAELHQQNLQIFLETSGAYPLSGNFDWICLSPKKFKAPRKDMLAVANELKVIVFNKSDFEWAKEHAQHVSADCKLYLQPEWSKAEKILPEIIDFVKENPNWQVSLQTHKYMHIP
jgi:7-carboxy-7-deazaguanine synthase